MDPITQQTTLAAAGGKKDPLYVDDVFRSTLWTGDDTANRAIVNNIDNTEGGLVWTKDRVVGNHHQLYDTERGASYFLRSDDYVSQESQSGKFVSFNNDGFTISNTSGSPIPLNYSGRNFVGWNFRKAPGFFDIVTWSGNNVDGRDIPHSLGSVPGMVFMKPTNAMGGWYVYHRSVGFSSSLALNSTSTGFGASVTATSSTTMTVSSTVNATGTNYVAYIFAHDDAQFGTDEDESIIKCGTYTGNSNTQSIDVGFEPQFLMVKCSTTNAGDAGWMMFDIMQDFYGYSANDSYSLRADSADQLGATNRIHVTTNGFGFNGEGANRVNASGQTYVYMAIRRPHKPPETGADVFAIDTKAGTSPSPPTYYSGFPVDWSLKRDHTAQHDWQSRARLTGTEEYFTNLINDGNVSPSTTVTFDQMDGVGTNTGVDTASHNWMFKRAKGFFDVIAYRGNSTNYTSINHGLGVVPEMFIIKNLDTQTGWAVYHKDVGAAYQLYLDTSGAKNSGDLWQDTGVPSSTQFFTHDRSTTNKSADIYVGFFFATLPGISKVGSFSGTGSAINVDCGFTAGARFVMIKRTDSSGAWYLWDTTRGYNGTTDNFLMVNSNGAQNANIANIDDHLDASTAGFTVRASSGVNTSGADYIFLAIA